MREKYYFNEIIASFFFLKNDYSLNYSLLDISKLKKNVFPKIQDLCYQESQFFRVFRLINNSILFSKFWN